MFAGPLADTRRAASRWLAGTVLLTAASVVAHVAAILGAADMSSLLLGATMLVMTRHATLSGWCRGWEARGWRELHNHINCL